MKHQQISIRRRSRLLASLAVVTLVAGSADAGDAADAAKALPEHTFDGLQRVPTTKITALYLRKGVDLGSYDKVAIRDCHVAFRKDWQREQNTSSRVKVSDEDMTRIKTDLAEGFRRVFTDRLSASGETVTTAAGTGVLILRPAIINLDVSAPERADPSPRGIYSAESAGQATLYLELYDSVTDELLARAIDVEVAGARGYVSVRNGATNRTDAEAMLKTWADLLGTFLQNARAGAAGSAH
jgi:Protein of unknown function (DUF3313)